MQILDLGGGYPQGDLDPKLERILSKTKNQFYKVIAEPGRHFSANSCHIATRVLAKRVKNDKICYHVNDSVYHSFNNVIMDSANFNGENQLYESYSHEGERL